MKSYKNLHSLLYKKVLSMVCALFLCIWNGFSPLLVHAEFVDTYVPVKVYPINFTSAVSIQDDWFEQNKTLFATRFTTSTDINTLQTILETGWAWSWVFIAINWGNLEVYIGDGNNLELTTPVLANATYTILLYADKDLDLLDLYVSTTAASTSDIGLANSIKVSKTWWTDTDWDGWNNMWVYIAQSSIQWSFSGDNPFLWTPLEGVSVYNWQTPLLDWCTDSNALNYIPEATVDDGSCFYNNIPTISLLGSSSITVHQNSTYIDEWATAFDGDDWDISSSIVTVNWVDTTTLWSYVVTYDVDDSEWNSATQVVRNVEVVIPPIAPWIVNVAPNITSYSWAASHSIIVWSGVIDVANIEASDSTYNVVWEYGTANLTWNTWQKIDTYEMCDPVVNVSHRQNVSGEIQRAPRVRSKTSMDFEVKVDNYNSTIGTISTDIDYMVINSGSHSFDGWLDIYAWTENTAAVACNASNTPTPTPVTFPADFNLPPVVTHTISSDNDTSWLVSWVNWNDWVRWSEPTISWMWLLLQRSFDSCVHSPEDIDYIAVERWNYVLDDWSIFDAVRSTDSILSVTTTWNPITFGLPFSIAPETVLVSQLWEDWWNGWYAQIHTGWWITSSVAYATIDEDWPGADRNHTNEVVSSMAFSKWYGQFWEDNIITYTITWGADSSDFLIDQNNWDLDFITPKITWDTSDSNWDWVFEVIVSVCDSHCNSSCSTQTIFANVSWWDTINPWIDSINYLSGSLLPWGTHNIELTYSDNIGWSWVDISSANVVLEKWNGAAWWTDISSTWLSSSSITVTEASYQTNNLEYWKYRIQFSIDDISWNTSDVFESVFYIDIPQFTISTDEIDIWNTNFLSPSFSPEVTITVKTLWAGFNVLLNRNTDLSNWGESIGSWDGNTWYWYDSETYTNTISTIAVNQNIASEVKNINTSWELQTYTYTIKIWSLVSDWLDAWSFEWTLDFGIKLDY